MESKPLQNWNTITTTSRILTGNNRVEDERDSPFQVPVLCVCCELGGYGNSPFLPGLEEEQIAMGMDWKQRPISKEVEMGGVMWYETMVRPSWSDQDGHTYIHTCMHT